MTIGERRRVIGVVLIAVAALAGCSPSQPSAASNPPPCGPCASPGFPPPQPTDPRATAEGGQIRLEWVSRSHWFRITRSVDGQEYAKLLETGFVGTEEQRHHVDLTVEPGRRYWYRVAAVNISSCNCVSYYFFSPWSEPASAVAN